MFGLSSSTRPYLDSHWEECGTLPTFLSDVKVRRDKMVESRGER